MAIEIRKSICSICSNGCPLDVWVQDDKILKVEPSNAANGGRICVKGYAYKEYVERPDRIQTPLRRVGERGSGKWEQISWDEAYREIAEKLLGIREQSGADSVVFYTGFSKWYRPVYKRFIYSFGTLNYLTESSACFQSLAMANYLTFGTFPRPDILNSDLFIGWAYNPFYSSNNQNIPLESFREKGGRVLIIDPRYTPAAKYADLLLRPDPGTDGALAHFFANYLITNGKADLAYIEKYVHGYPQYRTYVRKFTLEKTAELTNIPAEQLTAAAEMIAESPRFSINLSVAALPHHVNGMQNCRAILSLLAITGNFDREGGNLPLEYPQESQNLKVGWDEFVDEARPIASDGSGYQNSEIWKRINPDFDWTGHPVCNPKVGSGRFPLWSECIDEGQSMDLVRQIQEGTPYPIRAIFALGMNRKLFLRNDQLMEALKKLDFFVDVDLFWTDAAQLADIVLPACSSLERAELQVKGPMVRYVQPAIKPLYESKSDVDILSELAEYMDLDDPLLRGGYDRMIRRAFRKIGLTQESMKYDPAPRRIPGTVPYLPGSSLEAGLRTPTGKIEIYSESIAKYQKDYGLNPLPSYRSSLERQGKDTYPLILTAGGRIPTEFHDRFQNMKSTKLFRPEAAADLNPADAKKLGISQGDIIRIRTPAGFIRVKADVTHIAKEGVVFMYQDYAGEGNVNQIIGENHLDPYSGYPGYRTVRCRVEREDTEK